MRQHRPQQTGLHFESLQAPVEVVREDEGDSAIVRTLSWHDPPVLAGNSAGKAAPTVESPDSSAAALFLSRYAFSHALQPLAASRKSGFLLSPETPVGPSVHPYVFAIRRFASRSRPSTRCAPTPVSAGPRSDPTCACAVCQTDTTSPIWTGRSSLRSSFQFAIDEGFVQKRQSSQKVVISHNK